VDQGHLARGWNRRNCTGQIGNLVGSSSYLTSGFGKSTDKTFFPITEHEYLIAQSNQSHFSKHTISFFGNVTQLYPDRRQYLTLKRENLLAESAVDPGTGRFDRCCLS